MFNSFIFLFCFCCPISDEDESPIPRKATMARGSATRQKVPPISPSSDFYDDNDSAYAPSEGSRSGVCYSLTIFKRVMKATYII